MLVPSLLGWGFFLVRVYVMHCSTSPCCQAVAYVFLRGQNMSQSPHNIYSADSPLHVINVVSLCKFVVQDNAKKC